MGHFPNWPQHLSQWLYFYFIWIAIHKLNPCLFLFSVWTDFPPPDATGCDVYLTVTDTKQFFATEGYPHNYKDNQDCHLNFIAPLGRRIVVFFVDFHLDYVHDFLYLRK